MTGHQISGTWLLFLEHSPKFSVDPQILWTRKSKVFKSGNEQNDYRMIRRKVSGILKQKGSYRKTEQEPASEAETKERKSFPPLCSHLTCHRSHLTCHRSHSINTQLQELSVAFFFFFKFKSETYQWMWAIVQTGDVILNTPNNSRIY